MLKLNLGCGENYKEGYVNVDIDPKVNPDVVADVNITPWIWAKSDSVDRIEMNNLAEHLKNFIDIAEECHWVLKNGGILWIKVPFIKTEISKNASLAEIQLFLKELSGSILDCFSDPTHVGLKFTTRTFDYFDSEHYRWQKFGKSYQIPKFKRVRQVIKDRFLIVELEAIK